MIWRRNTLLAIVLVTGIVVLTSVVPWLNNVLDVLSNVLAVPIFILVIAAIIGFVVHVWRRVPALSAARRRAILSGQVGHDSAAGPTVSTGVAAEWGVTGRAATLVVFDDDTVILYFYPRAALLGSTRIRQLDDVVMLGSELRTGLRRLAHRCVRAYDFPLPRPGELTFYVIEAEGTRCAGPLLRRELSGADHPFGAMEHLATRLLARVCATLPAGVPAPVLDLVTEDRGVNRRGLTRA